MHPESASETIERLTGLALKLLSHADFKQRSDLLNMAMQATDNPPLDLATSQKLVHG